MKVAISTEKGHVSSHFGRCQSYTIVEIENGQILKQEEIPNPGHQPGFLPQYLSEMNVSCIIAGGMGPRAQSLFAQKNIETLIGVQGPIDEVIEKLINQELEIGDDLCDHRHGMGKHSDHPFHNAHHHKEQETKHPTRKKICFTSLGKELHSELDSKFGRAHYFLIIDPDTSQLEVFENPNKETVQGAGIMTAQFISRKDVGTVVTGSCGPNARKVLEASGIRVVEGASGKITDLLEKFKTEVKQ
jgi:predicted Fe-Mo cluster-binding NifX family protein